jgi:hypothetical protein
VILGGYFPKLVQARPDWLAQPRAEEVCSVSTCVSAGPADWIHRWLHNWLGWFNTVADARSVIPSEEGTRYRVFAYRLAPTFYRAGQREPVIIPEDVKPEPLPSGATSLGFDTYSKSMESILGPECSPLSCNSMASEFAVNRHCLLPTLEEANVAAERFSVEQPEPGDYYVAEVLELPCPAGNNKMQQTRPARMAARR